MRKHRSRRPADRGGLTVATARSPPRSGRRSSRSAASRTRDGAEARAESGSTLDLEEGDLAAQEGGGEPSRSQARSAAGAGAGARRCDRGARRSGRAGGGRALARRGRAAPAVEHDWLTQPLEEVSEPPAEAVSPVALVPERRRAGRPPDRGRSPQPVPREAAARARRSARRELDAADAPCCPSCSRSCLAGAEAG